MEGNVNNLMSTIDLISTTLDSHPESWREQLQAIRDTTNNLDFSDSTPNNARKQWQIPLITVFQRVAFADADNGPIHDIADWCLRQTLTLLHVYPDDTILLSRKLPSIPFHFTSCPNILMKVIGRNWLLRAQKSLANIYRAERGSTSSSASDHQPTDQTNQARARANAEQRFQTQDYVEARGILLPATDYLKRAVDTARENGVDGGLLSMVR